MDPKPYSFFLTSNGVETTPDFANRTCIVRLRKRDGFAFRVYSEGDLRAHVQANRGKYLGAVFKIITEHANAGWKMTGTTAHDFRQWAQTLDAIISQTMGFADGTLLDGHRSAKLRMANPAVSFFRSIGIALANDNRLGQEVTATDIAELAEQHGVDVPGAKDGDEYKRRKCVGMQAGRAFGKGAELEIDDLTVTRREEKVARGDGEGYINQWRYIFAKVATGGNAP